MGCIGSQYSFHFVREGLNMKKVNSVCFTKVLLWLLLMAQLHYILAAPQFQDQQGLSSINSSPITRLISSTYPYYSRPRYRHPFYDEEGNGKLLYGYGDNRLYHYRVFNPLEGHFR